MICHSFWGNVWAPPIKWYNLLEACWKRWLHTQKVYTKQYNPYHSIFSAYIYTVNAHTSTHTHRYSISFSLVNSMDSRECRKAIINADSFSRHTMHDDHRTIHQRGNSPARLSANVDSLCTSETRVTVSQKLSWLTPNDPQRGKRERQTTRTTEWGEGLHFESSEMMKDKLELIC